MDLAELSRPLFADDVPTRLAALAVLAERDDSVPLTPEISRGLLLCLAHNHKAVQRGAATQLARFASIQPGLLDALQHKLRDPDARVRWTAAFTLSLTDLSVPTSLPVLIENLGHEESDLRWAAATAIVRLAEKHTNVADAMLQLAADGNAVQRRMAFYCLRDLGETDAAAHAVYLNGLRDADAGVRLAALSCMGRLQIDTAEIRDMALQLLDADTDVGVRRAAAVALGQRGDATTLVIDALVRAARSDDTGLSKAAAGALKRLQPE